MFIEEAGEQLYYNEMFAIFFCILPGVVKWDGPLGPFQPKPWFHDSVMISLLQKLNAASQVPRLSCPTALGAPVGSSSSAQPFLQQSEHTTSTFVSHTLHVIEGKCAFLRNATKNWLNTKAMQHHPFTFAWQVKVSFPIYWALLQTGLTLHANNGPPSKRRRSLTAANNFQVCQSQRSKGSVQEEAEAYQGQFSFLFLQSIPNILRDCFNSPVWTLRRPS